MKILITGASSGIGFAAAKAFAQQGYEVFAAARRVDKLRALEPFGVTAVALDITDAAQREAAIGQVGPIDVLINNAGFGFYGPIEDVPEADAKRQFEVNVFSLVELTKLVVPSMRAQGRGRIINTGSMGGRFTMPFGGWYHATKYTVEALSDAMRMELKPFGIDVVLIEPGGIKTEWGIISAANLQKSAAGGVYEREATKLATSMQKTYSGSLLSDPDVVVKAMVRAVNAKKPRARYLVGRGARLLVGLKTVLPDRAFDRLIALI